LSSVEIVKNVRSMSVQELEWAIKDAEIGLPISARGGLRVVTGGGR
jgi:hypothetical protein